MSSKQELEPESELAAMILVELVVWLDDGLEEELLEDNLFDKDFLDHDLPKVLPLEVLDEAVSSSSRLWHSEVT